MPITTGNFAKALWPGINAWYGKAYDEHKVEYTDLFDTFSMRKAWVEDVGISSFGLAQVKGEGASITYDTEQQGFITRYTPVVYALGFIITREMVEDDLYDVAGEKKAKALAFSMRQTKENIGANVYNRAFNSTYVGGDGKELLATDHPNVAGGTWSNELTTAADISEAAFEQAVIDIGKWQNDRGLRIAVRPQTLIVPVDLDFEANKIMRTEYEVGTANNTVNIVRGRFPGGVKINHYLTDTDAWFIRTNVQDGMKYFTRRSAEFDVDESDFDTENAKYKATERYALGWTDPKALFGSPGA
jgi:hypothetical protein